MKTGCGEIVLCGTCVKEYDLQYDQNDVLVSSTKCGCDNKKNGNIDIALRILNEEFSLSSSKVSKDRSHHPKEQKESILQFLLC
jgi:hypothetical protein